MIFFGIVSFLFWPLCICGLIIFFVRGKHKNPHASSNTEWYLQLALSKEDGVSQLLLLLAIFFLGLTLLAFNKDMGNIVSWRIILLMTSLCSIGIAYYAKAFYLLFFGLISITVWWVAQASEWVQAAGMYASGLTPGREAMQTTTILVGVTFILLLLYCLGHLHEQHNKWKRFSLTYLSISIVSITCELFFLSSQFGLSALEAMTRGSSFITSWPMIISLMSMLGTLIAIAIYIFKKKLISHFELIAILFLAAIFGIIPLLPEQKLLFYAGSQQLSGDGSMWALFFNILVFAELLGLIFSGYLRKETWLINMGALFLFLLIIVKYFDWFFSFLDKSIFFIGAGILLFAVGWFMEKGRRMMIASIKTQPQQSPKSL